MSNTILFSAKITHKPLALALLMALPAYAQQHSLANPSTFDAVVVTAPRHAGPLQLHTDPKASRQPLPAQDGADFLAHIPGFAQIRKGGASGDAIFRGMSGSRVGILFDGQEIYGGCPMRMDPPTAYIYPESFDAVRITKGPQSVRYGAGQSAATVNFEHHYQRADAFAISGSASATTAQAARNDQSAHLAVASPDYYFKYSGVHAQANNYQDGNGNKVHAQYRRWNNQMALGWTPDESTRLELSGNLGDGEAAAADSPMMDGSQYRRENIALLLEKQHLTPTLQKVQMRLYRNYVDHVMDNYSLRLTPSGMYMASNPDRTLQGAYLAATLAPQAQEWELILGADRQTNQHRGRASGPQTSASAAKAAYRSRLRAQNLRFEQSGVFTELRYNLPNNQQVIGGLRVDHHQVIDQRAHSATRGQRDRQDLASSFVRYEDHFDQGYSYIGIGHAQRFPDFWERMKIDENGIENAVVNVKPEKLTQLDLGGHYEVDNYSLNVSAFYGHIHDYVLLYWPNGGAQARTLNVEARTWGFELESQYKFNAQWNLSAGISHVQGTNRTHHTPLAQQPPLQARLGIDYVSNTWSTGIVWRGALQQNRYHRHYGGIASQDKGLTPGFGVLALHAGWQVTAEFLLTAGIDNVLDKTYAQHLSKVGGGPAGIWPNNQRINEPGRTAWLKAQWKF